ncbi:branched-chain amino acid ABC transporter permease [Actinomadura livida]|uniref:Branched-chain amino acid ABC transporter permease n=1 Tax=Actinomadura livida TaxID=79909 RepID=A0A7W7MVH0_9ACTN|nr:MULTISPECIES: branched-chain amino acid ABC transporter permease [Actinomadura]MBB4772538.1 branched-subunit amino acid ABC-type transport system permease component [Actinomadura catellatispora]GGU22341.1 branched-chain amino acid ABC transporter permease [Actinomadura livida]
MHDLLGAELWQLTANGLVRGAFYAALGAGLALVIGVTTRFHFAYALTYTVAPYAAFWVMDGLGAPFWPSALAGLGAAVALSVLLETAVYEPVARRAADRAMLAVLVTSIGVSTAGIALLQLKFGTSSLPFYGPQTQRHEIGPVQVSGFELQQAATCVLLVLVLTVFLARTPIGRSIKAVRSNPALAAVLGIGVRRVNLVCFAAAGLISGACALWYGLLYTVQPTMGDTTVIYGFVVAFLAGTRASPLRALPVGVGLGLLEQWASNWLSLQWTSTAVFVVLTGYLAFLAVRDRLPRLRPVSLKGA